jgi:hypothetical protein
MPGPREASQPIVSLPYSETSLLIVYYFYEYFSAHEAKRLVQ